MKIGITNPVVWKKLSERHIPMTSKISIYEKLGGAYRLVQENNTQVFNKLTELLKFKKNNPSI